MQFGIEKISKIRRNSAKSINDNYQHELQHKNRKPIKLHKIPSSSIAFSERPWKGENQKKFITCRRNVKTPRWCFYLDTIIHVKIWERKTNERRRREREWTDGMYLNWLVGVHDKNACSFSYVHKWRGDNLDIKKFFKKRRGKQMSQEIVGIITMLVLQSTSVCVVKVNTWVPHVELNTKSTLKASKFTPYGSRQIRTRIFVKKINGKATSVFV